ncbi:hypothetical protein MPS_0938 [Mycobacterium pseudoshottsii JCM 15466]|nr:hypothetical protein MMSP_0065 [Mycobacterium sp. 012931]GAQ32558.1 hypothetical protein MPS_0938 [Mycobacterium pseudoshottsii JCM 15466]
MIDSFLLACLTIRDEQFAGPRHAGSELLESDGLFQAIQ